MSALSQQFGQFSRCILHKCCMLHFTTIVTFEQSLLAKWLSSIQFRDIFKGDIQVLRFLNPPVYIVIKVV